MYSRRDQIAVYGFPRTGGGMTVPNRGKDWFVSTFDGSDQDTGKSWDRALATMAEALDRAQTHDTIYFVGKVAEEVVGSNLKFDIKIVGCGGLHHADQPGSGTDLYDYGAASWVAPGTPTTATSLIEVQGRGWQFHNIMFDCPVDAAAILLKNNAGSGLTEQDASHGIVSNCVFQQGKYGIQLDGGIGNYKVIGSDFAILSVSGGCGIFAATDGGPNYRWKILDNFFVPAATTEGNKGNQEHIDVALFSSLIKGNTFGTVEATGHYIDLTGGQDNVVTENALMGTYAHADYQDAAGDMWAGNYTEAGITTANPAA